MDRNDDMRKNILYTVAKDDVGRLVRAAEAEKGNTFHCPACNSEMSLKRSGNTSKSSKRAHFAHKANVVNCSPETTLHLVTKLLVANYLEEQLQQKASMPFTWNCLHCEEIHEGDLSRAATVVKLEHSLGSVRPDILLINGTGRPVIAIEIVVTHSPEASTVAYYEEKKIQVIELHITSDNDIDHMDKLLARPTIVRACRNPPCPACQVHQKSHEMIIVYGNCWQCHQPIKVAGVYKCDELVGPDEFTQKELIAARSHGVVIRGKPLGDEGERVWVNSCPNCPAFVGPGYVHRQYLAPAEAGDYPSEIINLGHYCYACIRKAGQDRLDDY